MTCEILKLNRSEIRSCHPDSNVDELRKEDNKKYLYLTPSEIKETVKCYVAAPKKNLPRTPKFKLVKVKGYQERRALVNLCPRHASIYTK